MHPSFVWVDFSEEDRQKMIEVINLLKSIKSEKSLFGQLFIIICLKSRELIIVIFQSYNWISSINKIIYLKSRAKCHKN